MVKTLLAQVKEYKRDSILTPVFMILEVIFETLIPLLMASIINDGVMKGDLKHIYIVGAAMFVLAVGPERWAASMEPEHQPDLRKICVRRCMRIFRRSVSQILISIVHQVW